MQIAQSSRTVPRIFIGRWTPKILFSLNGGPIDTGSCAATWEAFLNGCLPELSAISNPRQ